jgi:hypothetical protein
MSLRAVKSSVFTFLVLSCYPSTSRCVGRCLIPVIRGKEKEKEKTPKIRLVGAVDQKCSHYRNGEETFNR